MAPSTQKSLLRGGPGAELAAATPGDAARVPSPGPSPRPSPRSSARATPKPSPVTPRASPNSSSRSTLPQTAQERRRQGSQGPVRWHSPRRSLQSRQPQGDAAASKEYRDDSRLRKPSVSEIRAGHDVQNAQQQQAKRAEPGSVGQLVKSMSGEQPKASRASSGQDRLRQSEGMPFMAKGMRSEEPEDRMLNELADATDVMKSVLATITALPSPPVQSPELALPMELPTMPVGPGHVLGPAFTNLESRRLEERLSLIESRQNEMQEMLSVVADEMPRTTISLCKVYADSMRKELQKEVHDIIDTDILDLIDDRVGSLVRELSSKVANRRNETNEPQMESTSSTVVLDSIMHSASGEDLGDHNIDKSVLGQHEQAKLAVNELLAKLGALDESICIAQPSIPDLTALRNMVKNTAVDVRRLQQHRDRDYEDAIARFEDSNDFLQEMRKIASPGGEWRSPASAIVIPRGEPILEDPAESLLTTVQLRSAEVLAQLAGERGERSEVHSLNHALRSYGLTANGEPSSQFNPSLVPVNDVLQGRLPGQEKKTQYRELLQVLEERTSSQSSSPVVTATEGADWKPQGQQDGWPLVGETIWAPDSRRDLSYFLPNTSNFATADCLSAADQKVVSPPGQFPNLPVSGATCRPDDRLC